MSEWSKKRRFKNQLRVSQATYVCTKHNYNSKRHGLCPICRKELVCMGRGWRIGRHGNFTRIKPYAHRHLYIHPGVQEVIDARRKKK